MSVTGGRLGSSGEKEPHNPPSNLDLVRGISPVAPRYPSVIRLSAVSDPFSSRRVDRGHAPVTSRGEKQSPSRRGFSLPLSPGRPPPYLCTGSEHETETRRYSNLPLNTPSPQENLSHRRSLILSLSRRKALGIALPRPPWRRPRVRLSLQLGLVHTED